MAKFANLVGFIMALETNVWVCLGGHFRKDLTEVGRATLNVGRAVHGLGSWTG